MAKEPEFASTGTKVGSIDVRLSYRIVELFSEGLYASPNKAVEELVANAFDAGALRVQILLSANLHDQNATIVVIDDGEGMDDSGLKQHWLIGISNKRRLAALPKGRQQIGKFGIGKLATYVLSNRLTHVSKQKGKYYSTSMDYTAIQTRVSGEVEPKAPIKIALRELTVDEAKMAVSQWTQSEAFKKTKMKLFGRGSPASWTVAVMSSLKPKVHEIKPGVLEWVLRTALPLRDDFAVFLNGKKLPPSKAEKGRLKKWVLGKQLIKLPKPGPKDVVASEDESQPADSIHRHGLVVPNIGRITGYAEAYKSLLTTGKSDELGRSHGFFVYVRDRLINVADGHFGISPDVLRHGTFGKFRLVVHMDGLDDELRSNRETISDGPLLETAQNVLQAVFNAARSTIEKHEAGEEPGANLARKMAASPASLSRRPIVDLARQVAEGRRKSRYLIVPKHVDETERDAFLASLEERADEPDEFVTGLSIDFEGSQDDGIAAYDTATGVLRVNAWHPFVATFHDEFASKGAGQPLELLAMAEVLAEGHLHSLGVKADLIDAFLTMRDQLLRNLANESGRKSALAVSGDLLNARNSPGGMEDALCAAFRSLGFEVTPLGGPKKPDGVATAHLAADDDGRIRRYSVSLEAKSKQKDKGKVAAGTVKVSAIARQRDQYKCQHTIVVGRDFPTTKGSEALVTEIDDDRAKSAALGEPKTITLITIDDLARLVRLRPFKQLGLLKLRELFQTCRIPDESREWINKVEKTKVKKPPYKQIIDSIHELQKEFNQASVEYSALRVKLGSAPRPIKYDTNQDIADVCKGIAQMAPGAISANDRTVELDQSPENVIQAIQTATKDYPIEEQKLNK